MVTRRTQVIEINPRISPNYRIDIDGLRAIAVVAVILNHIDRSILAGGYLGVDIFFVISGFVIAQSLSTRAHDSFLSYTGDFYTRRVKRLVPALVLCVVVTCLLTLMVSPAGLLATASMRTGVASLFGLSNVYLYAQAADYFGSSAELNTLTHTWSLGVEEQFYLVFPLLLWAGGAVRRAERGRGKTLLLIGALGLVSLVVYAGMQRHNSIWAFYMMPARFWELAAGAATYFIASRSAAAARHSRLAKTLHFAAMLLLLAVLCWPGAQTQQGLATAALVFLAASLIFWSRQDSPVYRVLTLKPLVFIGTISYSLYLWHWSVLTLSRLTVGISAKTLPFQVALMLILAVASYYAIETPLRRANWKPLRLGRLQAGAFARSALLVVAASLVILGVLVPLHKNGWLYTGAATPLQKKGVDTLQEGNSYGKYRWTADACVLNSAGKTEKKIAYDGCTFGDFATAKRRFLVIGDSYSVAELEMFKAIPDHNLGSVTVTSSWGASPVPELENSSPWSKSNDYYWKTVVPDLTRQLRAGDVLLMINDGEGFSPAVADEASNRSVNVIIEGLTRISRAMAARGVRVIYQSGNPFIREAQCTPDSAMPQWWSRYGQSPCNYYSKCASLQRRSAYQNALLQLQKTQPNFFVLDLFDVYCPGDTCKFYNQAGTFLYRDEYAHSSIEASVLARPQLLETIAKALDKSLPATGS